MKRILCTGVIIFTVILSMSLAAQEIPLPEHPRPDFQRDNWINLNGIWEFQFDSLDTGMETGWHERPMFTDKIMVPFPWGSQLSGVENKAHMAWYSRRLDIPEEWNGRRTFLIIGACDWLTKVWIDGEFVGEHRGGYTPFEFDLTEFTTPGQAHQLVLRVDDSPQPFKLEGKQGYGEAKGIWQTVYLESRGAIALKRIHFTPDIDKGSVKVSALLDHPAEEDLFINLTFPNQDIPGMITSPKIGKKMQEVEFEFSIPNPQLWELENPYLYELKVQLHNNQGIFDELSSYFGMRKISIMDLPGTPFPYVALNNRPVYLQLSLDQAYHAEGFYTYPSDEFMRDEIIRSKKIGLNGNRIHIKVEIPRKLYWADKLGLLIMADVPNFWGEPDEKAKEEWEYAMREMIARDYNHPSIFSWVLFNETWGLFTGEGKERAYLPETQQWVREKYEEAKQLDPGRLIEDNSPCNYDHVVTDLNTWHAYLPGYRWREFLDHAVENTYVGSEWNFIGGNTQTHVPMFNSECGNVWGYDGSTGDVDWSWDYHIMMNEFRRHPKVAGWLYTEHHDVINEWNGYYKYDRSEKFPGFNEFIPDMELRHLHSEVYLSTGSELCKSVRPDGLEKVPLYLSVMTDQVPPDHFILDYELSGWDSHGKFRHLLLKSEILESIPYFNGEVTPLYVRMPQTPGLYHLTLRLRDENAYIYHLNFTSFLVEERDERDADSSVKRGAITFEPASFSEARWSDGQWNILNGLKVNGAGKGYFSYELPIPSEMKLQEVKKLTLVFEASAKKLHGKDRKDRSELEGDYMRGRGTVDPSRNPNSYPMTDSYKYPTLLKVKVNGQVVDLFYLEDDPADHRGVLSWFSQPRDGKLREAGSYGYLLKSNIPLDLLRNSPDGKLNIRFEVDEGMPGGLAIYGKLFGRYALDPTLLFE
ncbi:MAG: glycoside hydrolase family 2 TIM barrel-domain containing protein [Bacteroidales bacterium]|nr:glycoside hydrolase family 2 TIM barrel-domain containing protein [Bacteroidales bacterium]